MMNDLSYEKQFVEVIGDELIIAMRDRGLIDDSFEKLSIHQQYVILNDFLEQESERLKGSFEEYENKAPNTALFPNN